MNPGEEQIPHAEPERQLFYIGLLKQIFSKEDKIYTFKIVTMGCQMNARDSEKLSGILLSCGMKESDSDEADLIIFNTCTVRENANEKLFGKLGQIKNIKKTHPEMTVAICGCMMQESAQVEKIRTSYPFVDIVFGTHNVYKLAQILYEKINSKKRRFEILDRADKIVESLPSHRKFAFKSGVNIMYGCDNFCSYCIVPYVRGREHSRNPEDIVNEITALADDGVVEVMLLGQNVNSYGKGLENNIGFSELLKKTAQIKGIKRIRFMTSHPKDLSDELIETIATEKKICRHLHLPLQSGSTGVLERMNRRYTKEQYIQLTEKIKKAVPDICITTDIIVGFPGETDEDFEETLDVIRRVGFSSAFTFIYSKRSNTPAADMPCQISKETVANRFDRLLNEIRITSEQRMKKEVGKTMEALVEEKDRLLEGYMTGRLGNNLMVHFKGDESCLGKTVNIRLDELKGFYYMGVMV